MKSGPLNKYSLPLLIEPSGSSDAVMETLLGWVGAKRSWIEDSVLNFGALLFRGFNIHTPMDFERLCKALSPELANYVGGDSPRQAVTKKVYTSTEYPAHLEIVLHNEMSYLNWWPNKIYFFCLNPPQSGGETHIGDSRLILQRLCPGVRKRFEHKQVMYVQTLPNEGRMTKSWQQTFETFERAEVEAHCRQNDMSYRWIAQGLRTQIVRPAVLQHPNTGDWVWFNQADQWHALSQSVKHQDLNVEQLDEEELPCHAYFGDGSPIEVSDLDGIRAAYRDAEVAFRWRAGDVLMLDNMLMAHGRKPFTGNRQVLVAMA